MFIKILKTKKMPDERKRSTIVPLYTSKGDTQIYKKYRGIKLINPTIKLWERMIDHILRHDAMTSKTQLGFTQWIIRISTMELSFLIEVNGEVEREEKASILVHLICWIPVLQTTVIYDLKTLNFI